MVMDMDTVTDTDMVMDTVTTRAHQHPPACHLHHSVKTQHYLLCKTFPTISKMPQKNNLPVTVCIV